MQVPSVIKQNSWIHKTWGKNLLTPFVLFPQLYGRMAPCFRGLGYGMLFTSKMTDVYYSMILAWCVFYLCNGLTGTLPWDTCEEEYNTHDCYRDSYQQECNATQPDTVYYR